MVLWNGCGGCLQWTVNGRTGLIRGGKERAVKWVKLSAVKWRWGWRRLKNSFREAAVRLVKLRGDEGNALGGCAAL